METVGVRYLVFAIIGLCSIAGVADPLPYANTYGIMITVPGQVTVSLTQTHDNTKIGVAFRKDLNDARYISGNTSGTFDVVEPQNLEFEVLNVPDNGREWHPRSVQGPAGDFSEWPNFSFSSKEFGAQAALWDFANGGVVTITDSILTPREIAAQAAARVLGEDAVKNTPAQRTAIANGAPIVTCTADEGPYHGPLDRGFCSTMYCGNSPETWVRGQADFDRRSGQVTMTLELETDSTTQGPKGLIHVDVLDANGGLLATMASQVAGIGGKTAGHSQIINFAGYKNLPMPVPAQANRIRVRAGCTGEFVQQLSGIHFGQLLQTANAMVTVLGGGNGKLGP